MGYGSKRAEQVPAQGIDHTVSRIHRHVLAEAWRCLGQALRRSKLQASDRSVPRVTITTIQVDLRGAACL